MKPARAIADRDLKPSNDGVVVVRREGRIGAAQDEDGGSMSDEDLLKNERLNPGPTLHGSTIQEIAAERDSLRAALAKCEQERDEYRALFEVRLLQRSIDDARTAAEQDTVDRIAAWLDVQADRLCDVRAEARAAGVIDSLVADIRSGAWKDKP